MKIIVTGTDSKTRKGGIGFALPGYLCAMESAGLDVELLPTYNPEVRFGKWKPWLFALPKLFRLIVSIKKQGEVPIVYSHAGSGVSLFREGVIIALAKFLGAKTVMQIHSVEVSGYLSHWFTRSLFSFITGAVDCFAVLTPWWKRELCQYGVRKKIKVIPNPLPVAWEERAICSVEFVEVEVGDEFTVLAMSRLEKGKGIELVVEAMVDLPSSVKLVIAGTGALEVFLREKVRALGLEKRVEFCGWVKENEKPSLFKKADIFCLPSTYDSFGMGFLEAMANGLPVVAMNWGPIADVVKHNKAGLLIKSVRPNCLGEAIEVLMDNQRRERMSKESKAWVVEQFSAKRVGNQINSMFQELVA